MCTALFYFLAVTVALLVAFLAGLWYPASSGLALWVVGLALSFPLPVALVKRAWGWLSAEDLFSPLLAYPLTYVGWFAIGSIDFVHLPSSVSFGAFDPIPAKVHFFAAIGLLGYLCGARGSVALSKVWRSDRFSKICFGWEAARARFVLLLLLLIAIGPYLYVLLQTGIVALRSDAGAFVYELDKYHLIMQPFFIAGYTAFVFLAAALFIDPDRGGTKMRRGAIVLLTIMLLSFFALGSRSAFVPPVLTSIVLYHYLRKPIRPKKAIAIVLILFMLLSGYGYLRSLTVSSDTILANAGIPSAAEPFLYCYLYFRYTVATFRDVTDVIPAQVPFQHGNITFMPFQSFLPGHHYMSDMYFKNLLGNEFDGAGQPATVLGPFYADFGTVGIFAGMFAWGMILTALYRWMLWDRTAHSTMIYAWATQAGLFGMFGGMFIFLGTLLIPLFWLLLNPFLEHRVKLQIADANAGG